jgi:O-antigen/teichoic acid export membrane protein
LNGLNMLSSAAARIGKLLLGDAIGARIARGGSLAFGIRMFSVALSYYMFVVLARHMSRGEFGEFGYAFSLATFIAVVAALGQPMLVLRFVPQYLHELGNPLLDGAVRFSRNATILGGAASAGLMVVATLVLSRFSILSGAYLYWTALLMFAMTVARQQAYAIRAFGDIAYALLPRDVLWRIAVIVCVLIVAQGDTLLSASEAVVISTVTLLALYIIQMFLHASTRPVWNPRPNVASDSRIWVRESTGLWLVSIVQAAVPNLSVVILGLALTPGETGPFFAAMKTATLLKLPLAAGAIVGAPLISRYYSAGQIDKVQKVSSYLIVAITAPVLFGFVAIVLFHDMILGFFSPEFVSASSVLLLIAAGTLVNALSGPTAFIMNMTGHHRQYLWMMVVTQAIALAILPLAAWKFGMTGAAWAVIFGMVSWNVWVWQWSRRNLGIDPTIFGALRLFGERKLQGNAQ